MNHGNLKPFALALVVALLSLGGCYWTTLDDSQHHLITGCGTGDGGISGDGGSPADAAVRDAAVDLSGPPDLWTPTCTYHWLHEPGQDDYTIPYPVPTGHLVTYTGPFVRYPAYKVGDLTSIDGRLHVHLDPYNPPYKRCPGCSDDFNAWAHLPRIKISIDVKAVNMPHVSKGDIDVWVYVEGLIGLSRTWWSPQTDAQRKLDPGHYELDFVVPFNVHDPHVIVLTQNQDTIDTGSSFPQGVQVTVTFKDSTTVQPCGGYFQPYPINMSTP